MPSQPEVAHNSPRRLRLRLPRNFDKEKVGSLIEDLQSSVHIDRAVAHGRSIIIEHNGQSGAKKHIGSTLNRFFPGFDRLSDELDENVAKVAAAPTFNKVVPIGFLALATWKFFRDGAFIASESSFAIAYLAFDVYWKFQQENVIKKLERGMSQQSLQDVEQKAESKTSRPG